MSKKGLLDDQGVFAKANKILPQKLSANMLASLAELEDETAHRERKFPVTRLHKIAGMKDIYRADISKTSGYRLHVKYGDDKRIHLCDILSDKEHDIVVKSITTRKHRYK